MDWFLYERALRHEKVQISIFIGKNTHLGTQAPGVYLVSWFIPK